MHLCKSILTVATISLVVAAFGAFAVDEHHPEEQKAAPPKTAPASKPVQKGAAAAPRPDQAPSPQAGGMPPGAMDNMSKMQQQMQKLMRTQDPRERERLLKEHMQAMQQQMKMMDGMMGGMGGDKGASGMSPEKRMPMDQCMGMMHKMMEQMLLHMEAMQRNTR